MSKRAKRNKSRGSSGHNRKSGEDFLALNRRKEGVMETDSGLQYKIIDVGSGPSPQEYHKVIVHQRCHLLSGKVIEDTYRENKPSEVAMSDLIEGYREGLMLMKKGARFRLYIPPDLAWGRKGTGTKIPPNAVLVFDVRLVDFQ